MGKKPEKPADPAGSVQAGEAGEDRVDAACSELAWDLVTDCRHCAVRQHALFSALRGPDFDHIFLPIRGAAAPAGSVLYVEDQSADAIYTVRHGVVKLVKASPDTSERIVRLLGQGAAVGLEALNEGIYWHTAVALRDCELCRIPFAVVDRLRERSLPVADQLIKQWELYVLYADRWITDLSTGPVRLRVHRMVRMLVEISGGSWRGVEMPSVDDLALIVGTSPESVSRILAELKRGKVLKRVAARTYDVDREALARIEAVNPGGNIPALHKTPRRKSKGA
jgi:CRP-like cAMP-binding protein